MSVDQGDPDDPVPLAPGSDHDRRSALLGPLAAVASASAPRTITVAGTGIVTSVPDQAEFSFGVSTNGQTATAALTANSSKMNKVIAAIKALGIPAASIQTAQISLSPNMNQAGTGGRRLHRDELGQRQHEEHRDGRIDHRCGGGSRFEPRRRALAHAVGPADPRAARVEGRSRRRPGARDGDRAGAKVKLGRVLTVTEVNSSPIITQPSAKLGVAASTPVEPGTVQTEEDVTVTFSIG